MKPRIVKVGRAALRGRRLEEVLDLLYQGVPFTFPTDTVYGIGVASGIAKNAGILYKLKGRPSDKPLPILVDSLTTARRYGRLGQRARKLAQALWPGALTLVVKPTALGLRHAGGHPLIGMRVPKHPMLRALIVELGVPLASTSANRSDAGATADPRRVARDFGGRVPLMLDGGILPGTESTVVAVVGNGVKVLREGAIPARRIRTILKR